MEAVCEYCARQVAPIYRFTLPPPDTVISCCSSCLHAISAYLERPHAGPSYAMYRTLHKAQLSKAWELAKDYAQGEEWTDAFTAASPFSGWSQFKILLLTARRECGIDAHARGGTIYASYPFLYGPHLLVAAGEHVHRKDHQGASALKPKGNGAYPTSVAHTIVLLLYLSL